MKTTIEIQQRQLKMIKTVMALMEEECFSIMEAEAFPYALSEELRLNSERLEKEKPFAVYKD